MTPRSRWAGAFLALLLWLAGSAPARAETVTLEEYRAHLAAALAVLEGAGSPAAGLRQARTDLAAITAVLLPSGETVTITTPLLDGVSDPTVARARLGVAESQIRLAAHDDLAARQALLAGILARPEFNDAESLWDRFVRWLNGWLERLFPEREQSVWDTPAAGQATDVFGWMIAAAGAILIVALLAWWLRRFIAGFVADAELRRRLASGEEMPLTAADARRQATAQASAGSYREAVRSLYLAALLGLEEREVVVQDRTLTNREVLARAAGTPELGTHLSPVVQTFDEVWYGVREPDAETFATYEREVDALSKVRDGGERAP